MEKFECEKGKPMNDCHGFCLFVGGNNEFVKCEHLKIIKTHEGDGT